MKGIKEYDGKWQAMIDEMIEKNGDKPYLVGFYNFISEMAITTTYRYLTHIVNFMNDNGKSPEELTIDDYTAFMFKKKDKTSGYRIIIYSALKRFSNYLAVSGKNMSNPMQYVSKPKANESQETKEKREHAYLEKGEIAKFISAIKNSTNESHLPNNVFEAIKSRDLAINMILLNTGMRISALYKLNVEDIDTDNMTIIVTDKGSKVFTYNISDGLLEYINDWLEKRELFVTDSEQDALFLGKEGTRLSVRRLSERVNKYAGCIKGKKISPHKLRATYGTMIYRQTKDIRFTQMAMNHSSSQTTELYIRGDEKANKKQAADIMSKIVFK